MLRNRWPDYTGLGGRNRPESPADLYRKTHPAFKAALKRLQDELFKDAIGRIKGNVSKAVENLVGLMDSAEEQIQIRACERVIEYAVKLNVTEDLEKRIEMLEGKLK